MIFRSERVLVFCPVKTWTLTSIVCPWERPERVVPETYLALSDEV